MEVPDDVFHDHDAFKAFLALSGGDPRREGEALIAYLEGWLARHAHVPAEVKEEAERTLVELQTGLEVLYAQDIQVARLEDELDILRAEQEQNFETLRKQYRKMVFWRGKDDEEVRAAADWVRDAFSPEVAAHILDTAGLLDDDIPDESARSLEP